MVQADGHPVEAARGWEGGACGPQPRGLQQVSGCWVALGLGPFLGSRSPQPPLRPPVVGGGGDTQPRLHPHVETSRSQDKGCRPSGASVRLPAAQIPQLPPQPCQRLGIDRPHPTLTLPLRPLSHEAGPGGTWTRLLGAFLC